MALITPRVRRQQQGRGGTRGSFRGLGAAARAALRSTRYFTAQRAAHYTTVRTVCGHPPRSGDDQTQSKSRDNAAAEKLEAANVEAVAPHSC